MYCSNCGKKIPKNTNFCPYCGAKQANIHINQMSSSTHAYNNNKVYTQNTLNQGQNNLSWSFRTEFHAIMASTIISILILLGSFYNVAQDVQQGTGGSENSMSGLIEVLGFAYFGIYIWSIVFFIRNHKNMPHFAHTCMIVLMILPIGVFLATMALSGD